MNIPADMIRYGQIIADNTGRQMVWVEGSDVYPNGDPVPVLLPAAKAGNQTVLYRYERGAASAYQELLDRSSRISALIRSADAQMRRSPSAELAARIRALEVAEREARAAVRSHPDHSYEGL